jgi:glycosyltransferase involved in cell wall biosynthesis
VKILFLSRWWPNPANNGSKLRINNIIRLLAEYHQVTLLSFSESGEHVCDGSMSTCAANEYMVPFKAYDPWSMRALLGFFTPTPRSVVAMRSEEMASTIRQALSRCSFDLVIASQVWMASYHDCFEGIPAMLEELELGMFSPNVVGTDSAFDKALSTLTWSKHRRYVSQLLERFSACTVVSEVEANYARAAAPDYESIYLLPNGIDTEACTRRTWPRTPRSMVFAGSFAYRPNYDAMNWFVRDVLPLLQRNVPEVTLTITGNTAGRTLLPSTHVRYTGLVNDVLPFVGSAAVSVIPLRTGAGTRLKVLESMALRTPVVATRKAVEGLELVAGRDYLQADTAAEFSEAVVRVLSDQDLSSSLADSAFECVRSRYDWKALAPTLLSVVQNAARLC